MTRASTTSIPPTDLPGRREQALGEPPGLPPAGRRATRHSASATPFGPSPLGGGHGDVGLSVMLGRAAETGRQGCRLGDVNTSASFQAAQLGFFSQVISQPSGGEEVGYGPFDLPVCDLHSSAAPVLVMHQ